eukprot:2362601-Amphidinium_carterae.3
MASSAASEIVCILCVANSSAAASLGVGGTSVYCMLCQRITSWTAKTEPEGAILSTHLPKHWRQVSSSPGEAASQRPSPSTMATIVLKTLDRTTSSNT